MPSLRRKIVGHRSPAAAASGVGVARNQAPRDGIPTASADLPVLWRKHLCRVARRRAHGAGGAAAGGVRGLVDGLLPPKQAANGPVPGDDPATTVLCSLDGQTAKTSDRRTPSLLRRTGRDTARAVAVGYR